MALWASPTLLIPPGLWAALLKLLMMRAQTLKFCNVWREKWKFCIKRCDIQACSFLKIRFPNLALLGWLCVTLLSACSLVYLPCKWPFSDPPILWVVLFWSFRKIMSLSASAAMELWSFRRWMLWTLTLLGPCLPLHLCYRVACAYGRLPRHRWMVFWAYLFQ
jgi:hypothetical protein